MAPMDLGHLRRGTVALILVLFMTFAFIPSLGIGKAEAATPLYQSNFGSLSNGSTPTGWVTGTNSSGLPNWDIENGDYVHNTTVSGGWTPTLYEGATFSNFRITALEAGVKDCVQSPPVLAIVFRASSNINNYYFWGDIDKIQIQKYVGGYPVNLASEEIGQINPVGTFYNMTVDVVGTNITAIWNNQYVMTVYDSQFSSGYIGVATYNCNAEVSKVIVTPLGQQIQSVELTALLNVYNSRPDLQSAFPEAATGTYVNLVNWAYGVVSGQFTDSSYDTLAPYGYWYALMNTYNNRPDLQSAYPNAYYSMASYEGLINWAGGVVNKQWTDPSFSALNSTGYWYTLMSTYNGRPDLQAAFPNVYSNTMTAGYQNLITWAGKVATQAWTDSSYTTLKHYGYWYDLLMTYNQRPDIQAAFPTVHTSMADYEAFVTWAGGVVTKQYTDSSYSQLNTYGYWYDLMMVYNTRQDLQTAYPNAYVSEPHYQTLVNWANGVVTHAWTDSALAYLNYYASYYEAHHT